MTSKSPVTLDSDGFPVVTSPNTGKYVLHRSGSDTVHLLKYTLAEESFNEPFDTFRLRSALVIGLQKELDSFQGTSSSVCGTVSERENHLFLLLAAFGAMPS